MSHPARQGWGLRRETSGFAVGRARQHGGRGQRCGSGAVYALQFTTAAARVPWASKSCKTLHSFGFGNCGDDRNGSRRLFGPNLETINTWVDAAAEDKCSTIDVDGETRSIFIDPHFTDDVSALRHGEHLANSGW